MDKLTAARRALDKFEAMVEDPSRDEKTRDAAIQRFEFTAEICWKALQAILKRDYNQEVRYPKGCYETAFQVDLIDEDLCLALNRTAKDRNLTSHTYHEGLAQAIYGRLPQHAAAFGQLLDALEAVAGPESGDGGTSPA